MHALAILWAVFCVCVALLCGAALPGITASVAAGVWLLVATVTVGLDGVIRAIDRRRLPGA